MPKNKRLKIQDAIKAFKISSNLWELFKIKFGKATNRELRALILLDLETEKLWLDCKEILDQLELKTTKLEFIQILLEKWLRNRKRESKI